MEQEELAIYTEFGDMVQREISLLSIELLSKTYAVPSVIPSTKERTALRCAQHSTYCIECLANPSNSRPLTPQGSAQGSVQGSVAPRNLTSKHRSRLQGSVGVEESSGPLPLTSTLHHFFALLRLSSSMEINPTEASSSSEVASISCFSCKERKQKCDKTLPGCSRCGR